MADVAADVVDLDPRIGQRVGNVLRRAPHEIVVDHDLADILTGQQIHGMRADQAGAADDHEFLAANVHGTPLFFGDAVTDAGARRIDALRYRNTSVSAAMIRS